MAASGNSLSDYLVVKVHEINSARKSENHLFLYWPATFKWRRIKVGDGSEGRGALSPDERLVVYSFAAREPHSPLHLRVNDLETGAKKEISGPADTSGWDAYPSWWPDSQEIAFIRFRLTSQGPVSKLMRVSSEGGEPQVFLGEEESVGAACYSPDGTRFCVFTKSGIEVINISGHQRTVILPWNKAPEHRFRVGEVAWSRALGKIAFAMLNMKTRRYELWTIAQNGTEPKPIYDLAQGTIESISFIRLNK